MNLKIISAGAGSGKTYRLTQEMVQLLKDGVRANGIIATTFTTKAAAELQERVRVKLLEEEPHWPPFALQLRLLVCIPDGRGFLPSVMHLLAGNTEQRISLVSTLAEVQSSLVRFPAASSSSYIALLRSFPRRIDGMM